jgi:hypothetical protein
MKLATIALASAFVLSTTIAFAHTYHHNYHKHMRTLANHGATYRGTVGMGRGSSGWHAPGSYGSPNNAGGLVGGSSNGTRPY